MKFNLTLITFTERDSLVEHLLKQGWKEGSTELHRKPFIWKSFVEEKKGESVNFYKDGDVYFFKDVHRKDGVHRLQHRRDGPAVIGTNRTVKYYLEGKPIPEKEFLFQQNIENILK